MQPIGTITNFFPFIGEETQQVLSSIMEQASTYYDFVIHLGQMTIDEEVNSELAFLAAYNVFLARERDLQQQLREKYTNTPEITIWTYPLIGTSDAILYRDEIKELMSRVIERDLPDWMLIHIHFLVDDFISRTPSEKRELLGKIESLLTKNQGLACFRFYSYTLRYYIHQLEGEAVPAILAEQRSLEIANCVNDVFRVMACNGNLGFFLRNHDIQEAFEYVEEFNRLSEQLGLPRYLSVARHFMGHIYAIRGEYDMALECNFDAWNLYYRNTGPSHTNCAIVSLYYSLLRDVDQSLHWAKEAFVLTGGRGDIAMHRAMCLAYILQGRFDDAEDHLNSMHKLSLESAIDEDHARYLLTKGMYETELGNPEDAIASLEQALSIWESLNNQSEINLTLSVLTHAEIQLVDDTDTEESSGPWMLRLESHARKKDYPGIQMYAALLRADFLRRKGLRENACEVLQEALEILDSPTVNTIRKRINEMLDDLIAA